MSLAACATSGFRKKVHKMEALDLRSENGPFDFIGDVHGCVEELLELFAKLGYAVELHGSGDERAVRSVTPAGRRAVFVGDLVDRGPASPDVLRIVMHMMAAGQAFCVAGNHDVKCRRWLEGRDVRISHGLAQTVEQMNRESAAFRKKVLDFLNDLPSHIWLDNGAVVVAHAGIKPEFIGTTSGKEMHFCLYGDTAGKRDEHGLPIRYNWASAYDGDVAVIYGHTPIPEPKWVNNTLCIDTGCVFGGSLHALRWPERELVNVPAHRGYAPKIRPFAYPPDRPADSE